MSTNTDRFHVFRKNTVGYHHRFQSPYGIQQLVYADWTATGRLYRPVEDLICDRFGPYVANTHSGMNVGSEVMSRAYAHARRLIKSKVGARDTDVLIACGTGATGAINKLQRLLGLRIPENHDFSKVLEGEERPLIFVSHMEHHSNHTSWLETMGDVVCLPPAEDGSVSTEALRQSLERHRKRRVKIGSFTACSNVTGVVTPYYELAKMMHEYGGVCFVDFSASAPYVDINMHPEDSREQLDAIFLSPHKFLGGPGSCGILVFDSRLYHNRIPDNPGGGTVEWTSPWGDRVYVEDIEQREDGGTPGILQLIRAALAFQVKEELRLANMLVREGKMTHWALRALRSIPDVEVLDGHLSNRLCIFSMCFSHLHYNLVVRLLNDRFGVQSRGGCSCAGTYGHYLLGINHQKSMQVMQQIEEHDLSHKPGWVRISLHPMMSREEVEYILYALHQVSVHGRRWSGDYTYNPKTNEFTHKYAKTFPIASWFDIPTRC